MCRPIFRCFRSSSTGDPHLTNEPHSARSSQERGRKKNLPSQRMSRESFQEINSGERKSDLFNIIFFVWDRYDCNV